MESIGNLLTLSVFDPDTERGTGHRQAPTQHVTISASEATPGYLPGGLAPGTWDVMINCNLINPGEAVEYQLEISVGFDQQPEAAARSRGVDFATRDRVGIAATCMGIRFIRMEAGMVSGLLDFARQHQLDFVTLTDHNTVAGLDEMYSRSSDDLLTMGGFELTTFYGHALALGIHQPMEWRVRPGSSIADLKAEIEAAGGLFVIAHPACPGDPVCTGCHWEYQDLMPGTAELVEIWNEHYSSGSNNEGSVELWYQWLNQGYRLYATVGTDIHGPADPSIEFAFDVVYAQELTEAAILDAVRHGHHYLSSGPRLTFTGIVSVRRNRHDRRYAAG